MNIKNFILTGFVLIALLATPLLTLAQDDDETVEIDTEDWVEFVSEDELFTISHPEDWFVGDNSDDPTTLNIANNEELRRRPSHYITPCSAFSALMSLKVSPTEKLA